jgi:hypothetical protein
VDDVVVEFDWFPGFAVTQAQRSIASMHEALAKRGLGPTLEISTKSPTQLGVQLSAFNLGVDVEDSEISVECAFQGSKVFEANGPFHDLYRVSSREAKKDTRLRTSGEVVSFDYFGDVWPNEPQTAFYDWLYVTAITQHARAAAALEDFNSFTDIAFNPKKSLSCQARSAAIFVALSRAGRLSEALTTKEAFLSLVYDGRGGGTQQSLLP